MPVPAGTINREAVLFDLREAIVHIEELCNEIERGEHDDTEAMVFRIDFEHIMSHLCLAWYRKWMSDEDCDALTQEEFELMCRSIPNWNLDYQLVDIDEPKQFDRRE